MKNIKCAYHSNENIVNFCRKSECLLPMCPTCVKIHSKEHMSENTHGIYDNINEIYSETQNNLNEVIQSLNNCRDVLKEAYEKKKIKRTNLTKKIYQMRIKIMESVSKYIDNIEKQVFTGIKISQQVLDEDFTNLDEKIQSFVQDIYRQLELLRNQKPLKTIITHFSQKRPQKYAETVYQITEKIRQINNLDISVSKEFRISQISEVIRNIKSCYNSVFKEILNKKLLRQRNSYESNILKSSSSNFTEKANSTK